MRTIINTSLLCLASVLLATPVPLRAQTVQPTWVLTFLLLLCAYLCASASPR